MVIISNPMRSLTTEFWTAGASTHFRLIQQLVVTASYHDLQFKKNVMTPFQQRLWSLNSDSRVDEKH